MPLQEGWLFFEARRQVEGRRVGQSGGEVVAVVCLVGGFLSGRVSISGAVPLSLTMVRMHAALQVGGKCANLAVFFLFPKMALSSSQ